MFKIEKLEIATSPNMREIGIIKKNTYTIFLGDGPNTILFGFAINISSLLHSNFVAFISPQVL